ncbi:MAG: class I SAM-dependent methyltransferase [Oscillospiraceae bacterium]|jgi:SAM-dependent methyltransferase|nr:class I SAM-dependent methyltransferase [Oscillospiraceae bacterium]
MNPIHDYYNAYDEDNRFASNHGRVEFLTTMRYIEQYLRPDMRVLEIGAGTGRYSHALARLGYTVDAVELVRHNIDIFESHTTPDERVTVRQGDALDLSEFADGTYDVTLLLGPMYHLFTVADKVRALSEAVRVTKSGGVICVAYCMTDASILDYGFKRGNALGLLQKHMIDDVTFTAHSEPSDIFELVRREDIFALTKNLPVTRMHYVATDGFTKYMQPEIDAMDGETFDLYLKYHFFLCERPDFVGITHHSLDVLRKDA